MSSVSTAEAGVLTPAADKFQQALRLHRDGQLAGARASYEEILRLQPLHTGALHYLGVISGQQGDQASASRLIARAIELEPHVPLRHFHLGNALRSSDERDAAVASYTRAIDLKSDFAEAYGNRGVVLCELGRRSEALADYNKAVSIKAGYAEVFSNRGDLLREIGRLDEALADCEHALRLRPDFAQAHCHRGLVLMDLGQWDAALSSFDSAIAFGADYAEVFFHRGVSLQHQRLFEQAAASYRRAIGIDPSLAAAHANLGLVLRELGDPDAALACIDEAIRIRPGNAESYTNRGVVLQDLRRWDVACASYDRAVELMPDHGSARYNKSMLSLLLGDFDRGWADFEWRWKSGPAALQKLRRGFRQPLWLGEQSLAGKTILLHGEQGFGDSIQFCRYARMVADRGALVHLEVPGPLVELLTSLDGIVRCIARGQPLPETDFHCPLMSLPLAFRTIVSTVPAAVPYLAADPRKVQLWQERLGPRSGPRVGLVWSGGFRPDQPELWSAHNRRNIPLSRLAELRHPEIGFHSLQKGEPAESELAAAIAGGWDGPPILDHAAQLQDFSDSAALIENLDLVISVDTSTAHLAGALGRPVWILNRHDSCWRWLLDREDSPWYPTARLYRQPRPGDWDSVIRRVRSDLAGLLT